jgi:ABC-type transport system involved in multi-copper enzyme maturation permease subunit
VIRQLIATDTRRFRLVIAVWLLLVAVVAGFDAVTARLDAATLASRADTISLLDLVLGLALIVLSAVIPAMVVQADAPSGTESFWMTRPIAPGTLLRAKFFLCLAVIVVVPLVAQALVMQSWDVPARPAIGVLAESLLFRLALLAVIMVLAAVSRDIGRFFLLGVGIIVGTVLMLVIVQTLEGNRGISFPPVPDVLVFSDLSDAIVGVCGIAAAALISLTAQYRRRSRLLTAVLMAALGASALATGHAWSRPLLARAALAPGWAADPTSARLSLDPPVAEFEETRHQFYVDKWRFAWGQLRVGSMPRGWISDVTFLDGSLRVDGGTLTSPGWDSARPAADEQNGSRDDAALRDVLGVRWIGRRYDGREDPSHVIFVAREADAALISGREVAYRGRLRLDFSELSISTQATPVPGLTFGRDGEHILVTDLRTTEEGVRLHVRRRRADSIFRPTVDPAPRLFLVNPPCRSFSARSRSGTSTAAAFPSATGLSGFPAAPTPRCLRWSSGSARFRGSARPN